MEKVTNDAVKTGQQFAHELTDGSTTGNINWKILNIDSKLNSMTDSFQRQQVITAMDKELSEKGILPAALQVFAEETNNHNILKADRRGMHADTLSYNLDPYNEHNATKLKGGAWNPQYNPVEMMLTKDLLNNVGKITAGGDDDEVTYGRLDKFAKNAAEHNSDVTNATAMLKDFNNDKGFSALSHNNPEISKQFIQNALAFDQGNGTTDRPTLQWMNDNFKKISDHGGITPSSMMRYAGENHIPIPAGDTAITPPISAPSVANKIELHPKADNRKISESAKAAEEKDAAAIKLKDTHIATKNETLQSVAIGELKAEGKISETATLRDIALAHKQVAYEEHLIRLYTPKVFAHLPNYDGKLQDKWVLNLVPEREMQLELDANKLKHHPVIKPLGKPLLADATMTEPG